MNTKREKEENALSDMKLRLDNIPVREAHNAALRTLSDRYGMQLHSSDYQHPAVGRIPNFSFATGYYRDFGIFIGFIQLTAVTGFSVLEVAFSSNSISNDILPIIMKKMPGKKILGTNDLEPENITKYFRISDANRLTFDARRMLFECGLKARMLVVEPARIRTVPAQPSRIPFTPPPGIFTEAENLQNYLDRTCDLAELLDAGKIKFTHDDQADGIPSYKDVAGREYPLAKRQNHLLLPIIIALGYIFYYFWHRL